MMATGTPFELLDVETIGLLVGLAAPCASREMQGHLGGPSGAHGFGLLDANSISFYHSFIPVHSVPQPTKIHMDECQW